jgi:hypothetical protein
MREPTPPRTAAPSWRAGVRLLLVALALVLVLAITLPALFAPSPAAPPAAPPVAILPAPHPLSEAAPAEPAAPPAHRVARAHMAASPTTPKRLAADEAEVCGLGVVRTDDEAPLAQQRIPDDVRALALQRLGVAMASSRDERLRAAETLLRARLAVDPDALAIAADADAACRRARDSGLEETARFCIEDQARSQAALLERAAAATDQLARLAMLSGDAQIYAFAFETCNPGGLTFLGRDGNCQLISAEHWARVAPDDAEPWLQLAEQALARGDASAASAALARAADAKAIGANAAAPLALATAAMPEGMPMLEQTAVLSIFVGLDVGTAPVRLGVIDTACAEAALGDAARRTVCDGLAHMLVERGRSSATVTAGVQLGERLGWPAERTGAILRDQRAALDAALRFTAAPQSLACDSLQRQRELVLLTGRLGEMGAGRELLRRERNARRATRG